MFVEIYLRLVLITAHRARVFPRVMRHWFRVGRPATPFEGTARRAWRRVLSSAEQENNDVIIELVLVVVADAVVVVIIIITVSACRETAESTISSF